MASKWKYAGLDAAERIGLLRKGNKELFDEEVSRTKEVAEARRNLGLDTKEQEDWLDKVGYNYSLSLVPEGEKVSKTGYADLYLNEKKADSEPSVVAKNRDGKNVGTAYISNAKRKIDKAKELAAESVRAMYDDRKSKEKEKLYGKYPYLQEQLVNEGASLSGGKAKKTYEALEKELEKIYSALDAERDLALSELYGKYDGMKDEIDSYRKSGTALESLGVIANVLIKNAARKYSYDASEITSEESKEKTETEKGSDDASAKKAYRAEKAEDAEDEATSEDEQDYEISTEETAESSKGIYGIARDISELMKGNPEKVAKAVGELLRMNGMADNEAATAVGELIRILLGKKGAVAVQ